MEHRAGESGQWRGEARRGAAPGRWERRLPRSRPTETEPSVHSDLPSLKLSTIVSAKGGSSMPRTYALVLLLAAACGGEGARPVSSTDSALGALHSSNAEASTKGAAQQAIPYACPPEGCPGCDPGTDYGCTLSNGCPGVKTCISGTRFGSCHCAGGGGAAGSCLTSCGLQGQYACGSTCIRSTTCNAPEICNGCDDNGDGQVDENNVCAAGCVP